MVQIHSPRPFISLESNTCNHFQSWLGFDFRSIRSNNDIFGRKFEAQTNSFSNFFAERQVMRPDIRSSEVPGLRIRFFGPLSVRRMLLRFQKVAVRGNYETGNQAFSMRFRFLTIVCCRSTRIGSSS